MAENREKSVERPQNKNLKRDAGPGRPEGQRNYSTIYKEALIKLGEINNKTPEELETELIASGFAMAKKDYRFYKDVLDRIHGMPTQHVNNNHSGGIFIEISKEVAEKNNLDVNAVTSLPSADSEGQS